MMKIPIVNWEKRLTQTPWEAFSGSLIRKVKSRQYQMMEERLS